MADSDSYVVSIAWFVIGSVLGSWLFIFLRVVLQVKSVKTIISATLWTDVAPIGFLVVLWDLASAFVALVSASALQLRGDANASVDFGPAWRAMAAGLLFSRVGSFALSYGTPDSATFDRKEGERRATRRGTTTVKWFELDQVLKKALEQRARHMVDISLCGRDAQVAQQTRFRQKLRNDLVAILDNGEGQLALDDLEMAINEARPDLRAENQALADSLRALRRTALSVSTRRKHIDIVTKVLSDCGSERIMRDALQQHLVLASTSEVSPGEAEDLGTHAR